MQEGVAILGGTPVFQKPLNIVRPRFPAPEAFLDRFRACLESGVVTNNGPWVQEFERRLSNYLGTPALAFCNGQIALMTMLRAAGVENGQVIVPSFTFSATPHAVRWCGAEPVFADIKDDGSFCLDAEDVQRKISPETVAILGVDAYGIASDYLALEALGRRNNIPVLFDSAPSFGSLVDGQLVGGRGNAQMFSFHATKAFATMEGGCICTHDEQLYRRAKAMRNFGQTTGASCDEAGVNGKMMEICALIGMEQLEDFDTSARIRRRSVSRVRKGLLSIPGLTVGTAPANQDPIWLYLPVVVDEQEFGIDRDTLAVVLERENIMVRKYYSPPCHHLDAYKHAAHGPLPVTERMAYDVIALPIFNDMTEAECDGLIHAFRKTRKAAPLIARHCST